MKQLTIRGVDEQLHRRLRDQAAQQEVSVNRYVLAILRDSVGLANGLSSSSAEFDDLDDLAGTWREQEYQEFSARLKEQRFIDSDLWQ